MLGNDSCEGTKAPRYLSFTTAGVSGLLSIITVSGNLVVCLAVLKDPYRELRTPFNFYIINLALADLIVGLITEPIAVWHHIREGLSLSTENVWLIHMSYFIACTASVLSLCALTMDRYKAIAAPLQHRISVLSLKRARITSGVIWLISLILPLIYFKVGYLTYAFAFANTAITITFITLVFAYVSIFLTLRAQVRRWNSKDRRYGSRTRKSAILWEKRITQVFLLMLLLFVCCYSPSCAMIYVMNLCTSCSCYTIHWLRDLQFLFVLLSSALNPFVYAWRIPPFRKAFWSLLLFRTLNRKENASVVRNNSDALSARYVKNESQVNERNELETALN